MAVRETISAARITAVILAGGRASRLGGADKCLMPVAGKPAVEHLISALRPQVGAIVINANRNRAVYAGFGCAVISDTLSGFQGPLAGIAAALQQCETDYLLTVPGDAPALADDYAARMRRGLEDSGADACVAAVDGRRQPVYCLLSKDLSADLDRFLARGGRAVHAWLTHIGAVEVDFSDRPEQFVNLNTAEDFQRMERILGS